MAVPARGEAWLRRVVHKQFGSLWYTGVVESFDSKHKWYSVLYHDGDSEELTLAELQRLLGPLPSDAVLWNRSMPAQAHSHTAARGHQQEQRVQGSKQCTADGQACMHAKPPMAAKPVVPVRERTSALAKPNPPAAKASKGGALAVVMREAIASPTEKGCTAAGGASQDPQQPAFTSHDDAVQQLENSTLPVQHAQPALGVLEQPAGQALSAQQERRAASAKNAWGFSAARVASAHRASLPRSPVREPALPAKHAEHACKRTSLRPRPPQPALPAPPAPPLVQPAVVAQKRTRCAAEYSQKQPRGGAPTSAESAQQDAQPPEVPADMPVKKQRSAGSNPAVDVPEVEAKCQRMWPRGREPWRSVPGLSVAEQPQLGADAVQAVKSCTIEYYECYRKAVRSEEKRYASAEGRNANGTKMSRRPDLVANTAMQEAGKRINLEQGAGFIPGIAVGDRFFVRAELCCVGLHAPPVAGIHAISRKQVPAGCPQFAVSVVVSGCYKDDEDDGNELVYTGQGGNDLLGNKEQVADQALLAGNLALVGNIRLGIPVRVMRKNEDANAICGLVYIFDGLYDVVEYWCEPGKKGFAVYKYRLRRRENQGTLTSKGVQFGGVSAPKKLSLAGVVCHDISNGLEAKPVVATNEVDDELPPCAKLSSMAATTFGRPLPTFWSPTVEYLADYKYGAGVPVPVAASLPEKYRGKPHEYIKHLNAGMLPYVGPDWGPVKDGKQAQLVEVRAMVWECGPWTGCPQGTRCKQAVTQQGLRYRLQLFKTANRGWGVRTWDTIPIGGYVITYFGAVRLCW